jgi:hypothetical protein
LKEDTGNEYTGLGDVLEDRNDACLDPVPEGATQRCIKPFKPVLW